MNLVIHRPNGECLFSHTESEASAALQSKRRLQNYKSRIRMVSRRLESEGLTPRQEEGQVEGGAEASGSRGETEEVWYSDVLHPIAGVQIAPPIRAGEQAGDLAECSDSESNEPALLHAPCQEAMRENPPPQKRNSNQRQHSDEDPTETDMRAWNRMCHAKAGRTREEGEAIDRAATVVVRIVKSCLEGARAPSSADSGQKR